MFGAPHHPRIKKTSLARRLILLFVLVLFVGLLTLFAGLLFIEYTASRYQARYLAQLGKHLTWQMENGPSESVVFPRYGIYDARLGYVRLPEFLRSLAGREYAVARQAHLSPELRRLAEGGLFLPYHEKVQAGLTLLDTQGEILHTGRYPERIYADYQSIPPILVQSLLFIENRELMDERHPTRNPAIEWDRLAKAVLDKGIQLVRPEHNVPGGSTLATQLEKYRHSPEGMTRTALDKLQQMASASVRVYLDGENTLAARRRIIYDYINSVPLSAAGGVGEVNGLGDGMYSWYGVAFDDFNSGLRGEERGEELHRKAWMFKHALSLMVAQRRPSGYLREGPRQLEEQTNSLLRLMAGEGIISPVLCEACLRVQLHFDTTRPTQESGAFISRKASSMVRVQLGEMLGMNRFYDLDRLDLTVATTLDAASQKAVTQFLQQLKDRRFLEENGLLAERLLAKGDPEKVIYSLNLNELGPNGSMPRVQADSLDQPFDINVGTKLDLGSTAKLRTLVTYLEIIAQLYQEYAGMDRKALAAANISPNDRLARWAADYLLIHADHSLAAMLDAALERTYSANPKEEFYTGGGNHTFSNFSSKDDDSVMSVRLAMRHSVNLVFIRLMRDIVRHYMLRVPGSTARILEDLDNPLRREYLERFADRESRIFMKRFYEKYKGKKTRAQILDTLVSSMRPLARRLAGVHRFLLPEATYADFRAFVKEHVADDEGTDEKNLRHLYEQFGPDAFSLADQGYIAQVHPLELWLARFLAARPDAGWDEIVSASSKERLEVYKWLMRSSRKNAQDRRIRSLLEVEAFLEIHKAWKRLGYPFNSLVPSFATSIGSSADRPAALAELMAILVHDGVRPDFALIQSLHFAEATPYETLVHRRPGAGERVLPLEVAQAVRGVLRDIVEKGTAARLNHALPLAGGGEIPIGGKTGTGDHRYVTYKPGGGGKVSRVVNRSATFVFYIGDRFYGTLTAFVPGAEAANYAFTSALPVSILRLLLPALQPLLAPEGEFAAVLPASSVAESPPPSPPPPPVEQRDLPAAMPQAAGSKPPRTIEPVKMKKAVPHTGRVKNPAGKWKKRFTS